MIASVNRGIEFWRGVIYTVPRLAKRRRPGCDVASSVHPAAMDEGLLDSARDRAHADAMSAS